MHYYQHHIGDFIKDTSYLTNEEVGIYMKLIWLYYDTEQPLVDDIRLLLIKLNCRDKKDEVLNILHLFFVFDDENSLWRHTRCDKEIAEYHGYIESKSKAGKASAERRAIIKATSVEHVLNTSNTDEVLTTNRKPITNKPIKDIAPVGFDLFWDLYDKKRGRPKAIKEWLKAKIDDNLLQTVLNQAQKYSAFTEKQFRKDPERWIKGRHWEDEVIVFEKLDKPKELPLGTEQQIEAAYRAECGDPAKSRFNSYFEMKNFVIAQREKRKLFA